MDRFSRSDSPSPFGRGVGVRVRLLVCRMKQRTLIRPVGPPSPGGRREKQKVETPLTPMPRNLCAVHAGAMQPSVSQCIAMPVRAGPRASRAAARRHHRCVSIGVAMPCNVAGYARGVPWCGLAPVLPDLQSGFGAGFEPATLGLTVRCSTQLSYPVVTYRIRTGDLQSCCCSTKLS